MKIKLLILILILISIPLYSFVNDRPLNQYVIKNWTRTDGLPQNSILTNKLTRDGYMWIGTEEGLVRFDGANFKVFDKHKLKTTHHHILNIQEDPMNPLLWISTSNSGLLAFNYINFSVKKFNDLNGYPFKTIKSLKFSSKNILWIGTSSKGICRFNTNTTKVEKCYNKESGIKNNKVSSLTILKGGKPLVLTGQNNIFKFDGKVFNKVEYDLPEDITINSLKVDSKGHMWVTSYNSGIFRIKNNKVSEIMPEVFKKISIDSIYEDRSGIYWVISKERGIFRLNKDLKSLDKLALKIPVNLREDTFGNLWISTLGSGLYRLSSGVIRSYTKKNGLIGSPVYPIFQRTNGNILLGSFRSGVLEYKDDKISIYKTKSGESIKRAVTSIIETKAKDLWFFLYGKGLIYIKNDEIAKRFTSKNGLPGNTGMALWEDKKNNIWGSTSRGDLFKISPSHKIKVYSSTNQTDLNGISSITEDSKGNIWLATGKGVVVFNGLEFTNFKPDIIFNRILSIYHHNNMIIMTGYQGVFIIKGEKLYHINHKNGLVANTVFASVLDNHNRLWFTSNNGVFSIDSSELENFMKRDENPKIRSYTKEDGLSSIECAGGSQFNLIKDNNGHIWFPTVDGVSVVNPKKLLSPALAPIVKFKTIFFDDNKKEILNEGKEVLISPNTKWIKIPIYSITHHIPKKIKYRYRLKNYDEKWLSLENNRVRISALPSGKYNLEVSATDSMGNWLKPISLKLNFIPHFYERPIFFVVLVPFIFLLILSYIKLRTKRIMMKNQELEDLIAERTEKIKELSLSDPLTKLRNRRFVDEIIKPKLIMHFKQKEYDLSNDDNRNQLVKDSGYAIFLLDIDHFKNVNDVYGHDAGDCVLIQLASIMIENVRKDDFVIRWGGEEFLIVLTNTKLDGLDKFAKKLKNKIENHAFDLGQNKQIFKTVSAGYLYLPFIPSMPSFLTLQDCIKLADEGLYYAKESGRNKFIGFKFNKNIPNPKELSILLKDIDKSIKEEFFTITVIK